VCSKHFDRLLTVFKTGTETIASGGGESFLIIVPNPAQASIKLS
jgi:hypothetical protein